MGASTDPDGALTFLPAEGAELDFYFPELALQGDTLTAETGWKSVCGLGPLSAGEGETLASKSKGGRGRAWTPGVERGEGCGLELQRLKEEGPRQPPESQV